MQRVSDYDLSGRLKALDADKWADTPSMDLDLAVALDLRDARAEIARLREALMQAPSIAEMLRLRESEEQARGQFAHDQVTIARLREEVCACRAALEYIAACDEHVPDVCECKDHAITALAATAWVEETK